MSHSAQPQHTNHWDPRMRKRHQQEHRPQRPTESSDPTQHTKGRTGDCPGPRKGATTRRNVTQGGAQISWGKFSEGKENPEDWVCNPPPPPFRNCGSLFAGVPPMCHRTFFPSNLNAGMSLSLSLDTYVAGRRKAVKLSLSWGHPSTEPCGGCVICPPPPPSSWSLSGRPHVHMVRW